MKVQGLSIRSAGDDGIGLRIVGADGGTIFYDNGLPTGTRGKVTQLLLQQSPTEGDHVTVEWESVDAKGHVVLISTDKGTLSVTLNSGSGSQVVKAPLLPTWVWIAGIALLIGVVVYKKV